MAKLGNPLGEVNLTKGAGEAGIVQGVCTLLFGMYMISLILDSHLALDFDQCEL